MWPFRNREAEALREEIDLRDMQIARLSSVQNAVQDGQTISLSGGSVINLTELLGGSPTFAGPVVTPETAMRASAVFACVRLIAGAIASLPCHIYERTQDGRQRADHPVWWLLNEQPTPVMTAASFWEWVIADSLLEGDGLAWLVRDRNGKILEILPLDASKVQRKRVDNRLRYSVTLPDGSVKGIEQDDMLHFPGFGFDGERGMSVIRYAARQAVGLALAAEEHSARTFSQGLHPSLVLETDGVIKKEDAEQLRDAIQRNYGGSRGDHKAMLLQYGIKAKPIQVSAADAQLLESRSFQVDDIARAFGVPPFMIGSTDKTTSWGSGIEQMGIGFVRYTLNRPIRVCEQEINRKLWPRSLKYFAEFATEGLMRGDAKSESENLRQAMGGSFGPGWMTVNEVRRIKNLQPVPGGDVLYDPKKMEAANAPTEPAAS